MSESRSLWSSSAYPRGTLTAQTSRQLIVRPVQPQDQRAAFELWMQGFREFFWIFWTGSKPQLKRLEWRRGLRGVWEALSTAVKAAVWPLYAYYKYWKSVQFLKKFGPKGDMSDIHANWNAPEVGRHFLVATTTDGEVVGTAALRVSVPPATLPEEVRVEEERRTAAWKFSPLELGEGELLRMSVSSRHRRLGIGSTLLDAIEAQAKECGVKKISLATASEPAAKFYARCGYEDNVTVISEGRYHHKFTKQLASP